MERNYGRGRTGHDTRAQKAPPGPCGILAQVASVRARFEAHTIPDDFVPGRSLTEGMDKVRRLHSNYSDLAEELERACIQRATGGGPCRFSERLAAGTDRLECPALSLVQFTLRRVAEEELENALLAWRRRTASQTFDH